MNRKSEIESIAFLSPFKFLQCPIDLSIEIFKKQKTKNKNSNQHIYTFNHTCMDVIFSISMASHSI